MHQGKETVSVDMTGFDLEPKASYEDPLSVNPPDLGSVVSAIGAVQCASSKPYLMISSK